MVSSGSTFAPRKHRALTLLPFPGVNDRLIAVEKQIQGYRRATGFLGNLPIKIVRCLFAQLFFRSLQRKSSEVREVFVLFAAHHTLQSLQLILPFPQLEALRCQQQKPNTVFGSQALHILHFNLSKITAQAQHVRLEFLMQFQAERSLPFQIHCIGDPTVLHKSLLIFDGNFLPKQLVGQLADKPV